MIRQSPTIDKDSHQMDEFVKRFHYLLHYHKTPNIFRSDSTSTKAAAPSLSTTTRLNQSSRFPVKSASIIVSKPTTSLYKKDSSDDSREHKFSQQYVMSKLPLRFSTSRCSKTLEFQLILSPTVCSNCVPDICTLDSDSIKGIF